MISESSEQVLLVEDSRSLRQYLAEAIEDRADVRVAGAGSLSEAQALIEQGTQQFFVGILDLNLPDAPNGEIVDLVVETGLPIIVLTGYMDDGLRERILAKPNVIDYVVKTNASEIDYVANLVRRIHRNNKIKVLIVDDSRSFRVYLRELLRTHRYQTLEAADGEEALAMLQQHHDIRLMLTDFHMPKMDGQTLIAQARRHFDRNQIGIIGISDQSAPITSAKLLKAGANDFIAKPFLIEEFYCRITQNVETLEFIRFMRDSAVRDFLTQLFNRRYLFDVGAKAYDHAKEKDLGFATVVIDIDHFKQINDIHGHFVGDRVLQRVASQLQKTIHSDDLLVRYGGEEFCWLIKGERASAQLDQELERIRHGIEALEVPNGDAVLRVTASLGATLNKSHSLAAMIDIADAALYLAKTQGRNRAHIS
ncbi:MULTISPECIES: diguanylate cyclase [Thiorhodovibrio]|uniref:diguanylate cyclase n=1 Tax=Thiorhodovibrio TaxID=61593 RepID=UPI001912A5AA|nr:MULTISPECIES: diguanylate cyclase [Thiorhodovibrio]MBK5967664.1 diguanylate cyclase response regulator [Thiorhodovibrio winogradskyi]WPL11612.1 Stalked cell differentiation-controlling protein [Thiorhodovibrio litoralis]